MSLSYLDIKNNVMFQTNNDVEDVSEFMLVLPRYINEGYDKLCYAFWKRYPTENGLIKPLKENSDKLQLPSYSHGAIADYASYLVYRNGNTVKQNRGLRFLESFNEILNRLKSDSTKLTNNGVNTDGSLVEPDEVVNKKKKIEFYNVYQPYK